MAATAAMAAPADKVSPNGKLDTAMTDFATSFVKQELLQLARERDDNLARNQVPRLRALLREVDRERDAFASDKDRIIRGLRDKLQLLQMDDHSVDHIVAELLCMSPKYLDVIPSTSTLSIRPPTPTTSPVRDSNNYFSTVLGADASPLNGNPGSSIPPAAQAATPELTSPQSLPQSLPLRDGPGSPSGPISPRAPVSLSVPVSPRGFSSHVSQTLGEVIAENLKDTKTPKRSRSVGRATRTPLKRLKTDPIKKRRTGSKKARRHKDIAPKDIAKKIAFPNLEIGENIFRHSEMRGFFVIRCTWPKCPHHFFTDAPLAYNRALRHFLKHGVTAPEGKEMNNDYIFEKFACQVEGTNLASKYWVKEHLGSIPHTFTPGKARKSAQGQAQLDEIARKHREIEEDFTTAPEPQDSLQLDDSDYDADERPRRTPRSVPRPDYAEIVANKDSWNESDAESENNSFTTPKMWRSSSGTTKRRSTKSQVAPKTAETLPTGTNSSNGTKIFRTGEEGRGEPSNKYVVSSSSPPVNPGGEDHHRHQQQQQQQLNQHKQQQQQHCSTDDVETGPSDTHQNRGPDGRPLASLRYEPSQAPQQTARGKKGRAQPQHKQQQQQEKSQDRLLVTVRLDRHTLGLIEELPRMNTLDTPTACSTILVHDDAI